jgi:hypothetical protein
MNFDITPQDVLAAISFEAQRIIASTNQHAAGAPFPDPAVLKQVLDRMTQLNNMLLTVGKLLGESSNPSMSATSGMAVRLDN